MAVISTTNITCNGLHLKIIGLIRLIVFKYIFPRWLWLYRFSFIAVAFTLVDVFMSSIVLFAHKFKPMPFSDTHVRMQSCSMYTNICTNDECYGNYTRMFVVSLSLVLCLTIHPRLQACGLVFLAQYNDVMRYVWEHPYMMRRSF